MAGESLKSQPTNWRHKISGGPAWSERQPVRLKTTVPRDNLPHQKIPAHVNFLLEPFLAAQTGCMKPGGASAEVELQVHSVFPCSNKAINTGAALVSLSRQPLSQGLSLSLKLIFDTAGQWAFRILISLPRSARITGMHVHPFEMSVEGSNSCPLM